MPRATPGTITALGGRAPFVKFTAGLALIIGAAGVTAMVVQLAFVLFRIATQPH